MSSVIDEKGYILIGPSSRFAETAGGAAPLLSEAAEPAKPTGCMKGSSKR